MKSLLLVLSLFLLPFVSRAQSTFSMSVLAGLKSVGVSIAPLTEEAEAFELTEKEILRRITRALSTTSLAVKSDGSGGEGPRVRVEVKAIPVRGPSHLYQVEVVLSEFVKPERELPGLESFPATTWSKTSLGIANSADTVLGAVSSLVEAFATEHRKENP